nr:hypothetical protein [Tanacetum cinerariifolium]
MFLHIEAKVSVKLSDVIDIFDKMRKRSLALEDNDAVRICLLEYTYSQLRDALHKRKVLHDAKHEKGEKVQYMMTGFVWAFMIWILEAIPATHRYVHKQPMEKIPRALAWELRIPFSWSRCCTLFVGDQLAPPLEILTPTKVESETDWWKASLEYFEGKHFQSEVVSEPLEIEKYGISEKKRKRGSSQLSLQDPTYDRLMTTVTKLEGTVTTLTDTVSKLHGTIGTLESRLLALEGDERDFGVMSDGDIPAYMSPGPSYTSPASTAHKSLLLANRRKLRVRRTPLKLKSPMRCYSRKMRCTIPPPASTTMPPVTTISVPMTTTKLLKDSKDAAKDVAKDAAKDTHLDAVTTMSVPMMTTETTELLGYSLPGGEKAEYLEEWKLDGLHINAFIELMMRKRPCNAQWTLGLSELVAFHIDSRKLMSMVLVVDALRATIDETNLRYPSWHKISQSFVYGTLDCGVMTCMFIEMLTNEKTIDIKSFGDNVGLKCQEYRAKMTLMLYETRCERPV